MPRHKQSAADYIERHDPEMRIILGELVEVSGQINLSWANAALLVRDHPKKALSDPVDAEVHLSHHVRVELADSLRRIRSAIALLDEELSDGEDDGSELDPNG
jgi:hypothetical protein